MMGAYQYTGLIKPRTNPTDLTLFALCSLVWLGSETM